MTSNINDSYDAVWQKVATKIKRIDRMLPFNIRKSEDRTCISQLSSVCKNFNVYIRSMQKPMCVIEKPICYVKNAKLGKAEKLRLKGCTVLGHTYEGLAPIVGRKLKNYRYAFVFLLRQRSRCHPLETFANVILVDRDNGIIWFFSPAGYFAATKDVPRSIDRFVKSMKGRIHSCWEGKEWLVNWPQKATRGHLYLCTEAIGQVVFKNQFPGVNSDPIEGSTSGEVLDIQVDVETDENVRSETELPTDEGHQIDVHEESHDMNYESDDEISEDIICEHSNMSLNADANTMNTLAIVISPQPERFFSMQSENATASINSETVETCETCCKDIDNLKLEEPLICTKQMYSDIELPKSNMCAFSHVMKPEKLLINVERRNHIVALIKETLKQRLTANSHKW